MELAAKDLNGSITLQLRLGRFVPIGAQIDDGGIYVLSREAIEKQILNNRQ